MNTPSLREGALEKAGKRGGLLVFHKGLILVFAPLLIGVFLITGLSFVLLQLDRESIIESRFRRCAAIGAKIVVLADQSAIDVIAWFRLSSPELMKSYDQHISKLKSEEKELLKLAKSDPETGQAALDLVKSVDSLMQLLDQIAVLAKEKRFMEMAAVIPQVDNEFRANKDTHLNHMSSVTSAQQKMAEQSDLRQGRLHNEQRLILISGLLANAALAAGLLYFYKKSILSRLNVVKENTRLLSEGKELRAPIGGVDEIAQLDRAFHTMDLALKEAAERERSLFNNASDVICVLDEGNIFQRINRACQKHWGFLSDELIGRSILTLIRDSNTSEVMKSLQQARNDESQSTFELPLESAAKETIHTLWSTYYSAEEGLLYCVVHDVSDRKRIEKMKQSYLSIISEDLKVPLSSISAAANTLAGPLKHCLSTQALARIEMVKTNLGRLLSLVNDLLEMSALSSGTLALEKTMSPVKPLLERSAQDLSGLAESKKISFKIDSEASRCFLDANRIMQVIVNLASNALKFSPEGSTIILKAREFPDYLEITVIDQGRGVPESLQEKIFEKFKQVEAGDGKRAAGTGLGLPICKDIVEEHGGLIGCRSKEGQGSSFWFKLPLREDSPPLNAGARKEEPLLSRENTNAAALHLPAKKESSRSLKSPKNKTRRTPLMQRGLVLITVPLIIEFALITGILSIIAQSNESRSEELRQRQVATNAYTILESCFKMVVLLSGTSREEIWYAFDECAKRMQTARARIHRLLRNDPQALKQFMQAERYAAKLDPMIETSRLAMKDGFDKNSAKNIRVEKLELIAVTAAVCKRLLVLIDEAERKEYVNPVKQAELRREQAWLLAAGLASNIISSLLLALFFSKNITSRLATLADNTGRFAAGQKLNEAISGNDELSDLDLYFHSTAKKLEESRKKERAVFDNSKDLIAVLDSNFNFISSNPAAERLLGCTQEELLKTSIMDIVDKKSRFRLQQLFETAGLAVGQTIETGIKGHDRRPVFLLWSISHPEFDQNYYCIAHDISDRKQLEQLKHEFLAVVSHDLRNPLSSVTGFIALIKAGAMGEPGAESIPYLDEIMEQAQTLLELINDLLELEKLEAQGIDLNKTLLTAGEVPYRAFESLQNSYPFLNIELPETNAEIELFMDRDRMMQVFSNIFLHMLRRARMQEENKRKLELRLELKSENGMAVWEISSEEAGYEPIEADSLFERFNLASEDGRTRQGGSLLALPLARRIVEAHGGSLSLHTGKARTCFRILIPLSEPSNLNRVQQR